MSYLLVTNWNDSREGGWGTKKVFVAIRQRSRYKGNYKAVGRWYFHGEVD